MKEPDYRDSRIEKLQSENSKYIGFLVLAGIIAFVFISLYFNLDGRYKQQSEVIDVCMSEMSDLNDTISTMNDSLDSISTSTSNAAGDDYETQSDALYDVSSQAEDAQREGNSDDTACQQPVIESSSSDY